MHTGTITQPREIQMKLNFSSWDYILKEIKYNGATYNLSSEEQVLRSSISSYFMFRFIDEHGGLAPSHDSPSEVERQLAKLWDVMSKDDQRYSKIPRINYGQNAERPNTDPPVFGPPLFD